MITFGEALAITLFVGVIAFGVIAWIVTSIMPKKNKSEKEAEEEAEAKKHKEWEERHDAFVKRIFWPIMIPILLIAGYMIFSLLTSK